MHFRKAKIRKAEKYKRQSMEQICALPFGVKRRYVCYWFEGEDAPKITIFSFSDQVPVRVFDADLRIDFAEIAERLWREV